MAFSSGVPVSGYISIVLDCVIAAGELDGKRVVLAYLHQHRITLLGGELRDTRFPLDHASDMKLSSCVAICAIRDPYCCLYVPAQSRNGRADRGHNIL